LLAAPAFAQAPADDAGVPVSDAGNVEPPAMQIESFEPVNERTDAGTTTTSTGFDQFGSAPSGPTVRFFSTLSGVTGLDTKFDSPRGAPLAENVWDGRLRIRVGTDVKLNDHVRVYLEGKAQLRWATERDFDRAKGFFEPMLGEAFVDFYSQNVDVRIGNQRIPLGANPVGSPADVLNPRDFREGFLNAEPEDAVLPVFAVKLSGQVNKLAWTAAYVPFFTPSKFDLFGQDEALLQPSLAPALPTKSIDPSIEDGLQQHLVQSKVPAPFAGDVALRVVHQGPVKIGASWAWINEKLPQVFIDPELATVMAQQAKGQRVDPATALSVENRLAAGEQLFRGVYARQHVFSAEASALLGPVQLDADLSYSPRQTFFDIQFAPISKSALTFALAISQAKDSPLLYGLSYVAMVIPDIKATEQIALLEPATAAGAPHTAFFHLFAGNISYPVWHDRFLLEVKALFEPVQLSFALSPRVTWQAVEGLKVFVAGEVWSGNPYSPFGYFARNDKVLLGARYELF
jgi:hypothetical protein